MCHAHKCVHASCMTKVCQNCNLDMNIPHLPVMSKLQGKIQRFFQGHLKVDIQNSSLSYLQYSPVDGRIPSLKQ